MLAVLPEAGSVSPSSVAPDVALGDYEAWENQASFAVGAAVARTNALLRELYAALESERQLLAENTELLQAGQAHALQLAGCSVALAHVRSRCPSSVRFLTCF